MSVNRRYNVDRRNVNNRTFDTDNNRRGQANGSLTSRKDGSPTRSDPTRRYGTDKTKRDPFHSDSRYKFVPELDEHSTRGKDGGHDGYDDDHYGVTGHDVDDEERDDWTQSGDFEDPDDSSSFQDKLFMTEEEMLQLSTAQLLATIEELESRCDNIENEDSEWKTRFETQQEMNQQLERQIILLHNKVEEARVNFKDVHKTPRPENKNSDDFYEASPHMIKAMEREKNLMINQLRDLEWRLDQESKAYHKANDDRKQYVMEINGAKATMTQMKGRHQKTLGTDHEGSSGTARTYRDTTGNIPSDQRIIDPKRGPIRKTAGVKSLPSLETEY